VVVVGAEQGHGKRSHVLSDYTFAVRDDATGELLTIGKAYSGLTDVEIEELTEHFTATTIARHGHYREVRPEIVLEIAFDSIQPSTRHASGLAMRFPRIKAIRRDKKTSEIDTLAYARSLVAGRRNGFWFKVCRSLPLPPAGCLRQAFSLRSILVSGCPRQNPHRRRTGPVAEPETLNQKPETLIGGVVLRILVIVVIRHLRIDAIENKAEDIHLALVERIQGVSSTAARR